MKKTFNNILQQEQEEEQIRKIQRQEKASLKFSKQRFMRNNSPSPKQKTEETDPQRTALLNLIKRNLKVDILERLSQLNVDLDGDKKVEWLKLSYYDHKDTEKIPSGKENQQIWARCLLKINGKTQCIRGVVLGYDEEKNKYKFKYNIGDTFKGALVPRLFICSDLQDPNRFCQKVSKAYFSRLFADNLIKFSYYIAKMPTEGLSILQQTQKHRIKILTGQTNFDENSLQILMEEAQSQYWKTMNTIILRKHLAESRLELVPTQLSVNLAKPKKNIPYFGLLETGKQVEIVIEDQQKRISKGKPFVQIFTQYCENTIFNEKSVVYALWQVKTECQKMAEVELCKTVKDRKEPSRFEQFQSEQISYLQKSVNRLRSNWITTIKDIMEASLKKGQSNWLTTTPDPSTYPKSKLKRYFKMVKFIMEDALRQSSINSFNKLFAFVCDYIPEKVKVESIYEVKNEYADGIVIYPGVNNNSHVPLFQTDLMRVFDDTGFSYATDVNNFVSAIMNIFNRMVDQINRVPEVEQKVLLEIFKKQKQQKYLTAFNRSEPIEGEIDQNIWLKQLSLRLKQKLEKSIEPLSEYLSKFNELVSILKMRPDEIVKRIDQEDQENPKDVNQLREEIQNYYAKEKQILQKIPETIHISFFKIYLKDVIEHLALKYHQTARGLEGIVAKKAKKSTAGLLQKFKQISKTIEQSPSNIEKLVELRDFMAAIPLELQKIKKEIQESNKIYQMLEQFKFLLGPDDLRKRFTVMVKPRSILDEVEKKKKELDNKKSELEEQLTSQQEEFKNNIESLGRSIAQFHTFNKKQQHSQIAQRVQMINDALNSSMIEARKFNSRQHLFERDITDYSKVNELNKDFLPYSNLWLTTTNWIKNIEQWMYGNWFDIDADQCQRFVQDSLKNLQFSIRYYKDKQIVHILKIAESVKAQIDQFRPKVPLLMALRKKGLRTRHWEQLTKKIGIQIQPNQDFSFAKALNMGLLKYSEICIQTAQQATKQFNIENSLNQMIKGWENINFEFTTFKTGLIIKSYDDAVALVDDNIATTQAMLFSPFKKPFEQKIMEWFNTLKRLSDILEQWAKLQMNWMYLQPIFDSPDIAKQLHKESKNFKLTDNFWRAIISKAKENPSVMKVCQLQDLLEKIKQSNNSLDLIQKSLNNYLESKRAKFARFYFLSNNQLLQILSQAKEPLAVQPYLKKVFENINEVQFDQKKSIVAMLSAQQQRINIDKPIDPKNKNVEDWMTQLQQQMKLSVRSVLLNSIKQYAKTKRSQWVLQHPGQCVLNGSQVHWTKEVEESLTSKELKKYYANLTAQLQGSVQLVRKKMSKNQSITLNALIVIDVHARDVVQNLLKNNVQDYNAFEWISQLRYYWQDDNCFSKCVQTVFPYGYEYLGNTLRLVITPLTDKCYMTLMGALKLNLGGAPAGPAGTGKTQSTKDLAKALAKQCVVFNCSDSMDFIMVGKFFKGLASAGAWACFDEFNRINIEVLSVIAQQLLILFGQKAKGSTQVDFEGSQIKLQPTFSVFITMNPGYAGRTQLPDNLKALFRPVAMMVPDYAMIGQIMLYSFGFKTGRQLAKKMVVTFRLASQQLSSQDHYDYGMRAVRSVINAAGILKEKDPDMDEDKLLLRALRDVNVPKFLKDDLPLFENIIMDLFPGIEKPVINYGSLLQAISKTCQSPTTNLEATSVFLSKTLQLFDTIQVRHGLMLVGPAGGGKTQTYSVLKNALSSLQNQGYYKVNTHVINPKSVNMGQLYGMFNQASRQWMDGVLAYTVRKCCSDRTNQRHWIMFDGPVDALWIQNMNTVLDDNKKLCLNSGQILTLTPFMTMMFEVEDLAVASPATVSRCGMVYIEPAALGVKPLFYKWSRKIPPKIQESKKIMMQLIELMQAVTYPMIDFMRRNCKQTIPSINQNLIQSFFRNLDCYFASYIDNEVIVISAEDIIKLQEIFANLFLFCLVWSIGATTDWEGRNKFNEQLKVLISKKGLQMLPNFYDYYFNQKSREFQFWVSLSNGYEINAQQDYHEVIVPTAESQRATFLTRLLLSHDHHVLVAGPTGTGKTINANQLLTYNMGEAYQYIPITFSAQTSANQTQDSIDLKLQKIKRGVFGAPVGKKYIVFVDDLNMPKKQQYGAQPPIELLRQFLDHKGWFNRKDQQFMRIENILILTALGPPGGGRTSITPRLVRHFNMMSSNELDSKTISQIFSTILKHFLKKFPQEILELISSLVNSVINVYDQIKKHLLPTPNKSHYTFNLRDISKVFQGICAASPKFCYKNVTFFKLWTHQIQRVFGDRLTCEEDRTYLKQLTQEELLKLGSDIKQVHANKIIFCDFWEGRQTEPRHYMEVPDQNKLMEKIYEFQTEYNADARYSGARGKNSLKLVLFQDACEHISRIVRVLRQPRGNALLLGVGGSGRQSLAKISAFIANQSLAGIQLIKNYGLRSWREDLKRILMATGLQTKPTTFLFTQTQIVHEQMLQDINSVLNSGDVTGLYPQKEFDEIMAACKGDCLKKGLQPNKMNVFAQYLARLNQNIHIVLAMSPLGNAFSTRLRMFPSLVNCCTLDWFSEWPEQALIAVGRGQIRQFLGEHKLQKDQHAILQTFKTVHKSVEQISTRYLSELRRYNYVTPMSYLQLLTMFKIVLKQKEQQLTNSINRLKSGLDKLTGANIEVAEMQIQLKQLQPQLQKSAIDTSKLMVQIEVEKKEAEETERIVSRQQAQAKLQTQQALEIAKEVDIKVQDANQKLAESLKAVDKLKTDNIVQIKSVKNPTKTALIVLGGCVIMFEDIIKSRGREIIMRKVEGTIKKQEDWMNTARIQLLDNPKQFLQQLKGYDKQHINQSLINKFNQKIKTQPDFTFEKAKSAGVCFQALYQWEMAMYNFNQIYLNTQPLRQKEAQVKQLVAEKTAMLQLKKKTLEGVITKIAALEKSFNDCIFKKQELTKKILQCEVKLDRAKKLTSGLSGQKYRWQQQVLRLQSLGKYLLGNSILSAAMVSYGGAFTSKYRQALFEIWMQKIGSQNLEAEAKTSLVNFLGKPVSIQQWTVVGLPKDENSIENGIIIEKGRRWPLMIDPQGQANKFIKNLGRQSHMEGIDVVKQKQDTRLMKTLELAIQNGKWFLLQNVGKQLEQALEPILLQQVVKTSGSLSITLGDKNLAYNSSFKMFMTTTLPNPHYSPETFVKVTVINFAITPQGLEDQMLAELVALENPQLQQKKREIVKRNAADQKQLLNIEDNILMSLSQGNGGVAELLLDESLINQLQNSKKFAEEINQRIQDSRITEQQIDRTRQGYRSVAFRASILFFCIIDLSGIDPMYQYSLQWFINLFKLAVENALPAKQLESRLLNLINYFTFSLYQNVCRSLFQKHKLLFSFMLAANIQFGKKQLSQQLWRLFLAGPSSDPSLKPNPTKWISDSSWPDIFRHLTALQQNTKLNGFYDDFMASPDKFKRLFDSPKPHEQQLPTPWNNLLDEFEKLLVLKAIRIDKVTSGIQQWISVKVGKQFIISPTFDLPKCYKDSNNLTPLIFLLSPGSDPVTDFTKFAKQMQKKTESISLGQGQGPKAQELVRSGQLKGTWILLQNCHLAASWMSELEKVVEQFGDNTHKQFRLWLTSMPTGTFPISVLQNSVKMTIQPPQGLRANLLRSYASITEAQFKDCKKPAQFHTLLFGFCFFHAIIQDRRKFGPIGWNIAYQFTNQDLSVCKRQLKMLLDEYQIVPFKVLNYLGAEINYGGRVTDDKDVRLIKAILKKYINPNVFEPGYVFSPSGIYYPPNQSQLSNFVSYIENLPLTPSPEIFGLHDNAQITTAQNQTLSLLESILSIQPRVSNSSGKNREQVIFELAESIQSRTPEIFNIQEIMKRYPTDYNESMNTVLVQQLVRYNRLLDIMKSSLVNLKKALKGLVVMSEDLEKLSNSIFDNQVGKLWADKGFLSLKPLGSWMDDLIARVRFLNQWIKEGTPKIFWMSGFFFPQAFVTGSLQNYARKKTIAIDKLNYKFSLLDKLNQPSDIHQKPQFGCYIYGLFLEGCRWDYVYHNLTDSKPKQLFSPLPIIHLVPTEDKLQSAQIYQCPLYKVVSRSGTLSTTGHSTNFVMFIELPTEKRPEEWVSSGVAAFLSLRY